MIRTNRAIKLDNVEIISLSSISLLERKQKEEREQISSFILFVVIFRFYSEEEHAVFETSTMVKD